MSGNEVAKCNQRIASTGPLRLTTDVDRNSGGNKVYRAGVAVLAAKCGCSKEDARKILYAGSKMGIKFLDLNSAEEALQLIDERDRRSLHSRHSDRAPRLKETSGTSNLLKVYTSKKKGLRRGKKQGNQ